MLNKFGKKNNKNVENKPSAEGTAALELCIDYDHVTIPLERYTELIAAEVKLGIASDIYNNTSSYDLEKRLSFLKKPDDSEA